MEEKGKNGNGKERDGQGNGRKGKITKRGKEIKKTIRKKEDGNRRAVKGILFRKRGKDWGEKERVTEGRE